MNKLYILCAFKKYLTSNTGLSNREPLKVLNNSKLIIQKLLMSPIPQTSSMDLWRVFGRENKFILDCSQLVLPLTLISTQK